MFCCNGFSVLILICVVLWCVCSRVVWFVVVLVVMFCFWWMLVVIISVSGLLVLVCLIFLVRLVKVIIIMFWLVLMFFGSWIFGVVCDVNWKLLMWWWKLVRMNCVMCRFWCWWKLCVIIFSCVVNRVVWWLFVIILRLYGVVWNLFVCVWLMVLLLILR